MNWYVTTTIKLMGRYVRGYLNKETLRSSLVHAFVIRVIRRIWDCKVI